PHVARAKEGAGNLLYNNGFVKPMEFVKNRFVKTRLAEDATRVPGLGADRFDYRAAVNPSGAVPAAAVDLGSMNRKLHARVLARVSADRDELDAYNAAVWRFREAKKKRRDTAKARLAARKPGEVPEPLPDPPEAPVKPRWAQAW